MDTVSYLSQGVDEIVSPDELLLLAQDAGFPVNLCRAGLIEYGESVVQLIVRRMLLTAKMTFLAAYEYFTYATDGGFVVVENPNDVNGYYIEGTKLEAVVDEAYAQLAEVLNASN